MHPSTRENEREAGFPSRGLVALLRESLSAPVTGALEWRTIFWLGLSLIFAAYFASEAVRQAFSSEYVTQDDARQHIFWMYRYVDAGLFPNDLIADYFQSIAPLGYSIFYRALIAAGFDPLLLSKVMPLILALVATGFCFGACMRMLPVPGAAFFSALILNQSMWMQDDLVSATPRAFAYPLFLGFIYFLLRGSLVGCMIFIALQGLFYPATAFVSVGVLVLRLIRFNGKTLIAICKWEQAGSAGFQPAFAKSAGKDACSPRSRAIANRYRFSHEKRDYILCAAGLGALAVVLLSYMLKTSVYGPVVTGSQARMMPEFLPGGRTAFFGFDFWRFWLTGKRSGMIPDTLLSDIPAYLGLLLPLVLLNPERFPLARKIAGAGVLPRVVVASLFMFFAAHLLLFKLHHPNRYTAHTFRVAVCISAGIVLTILLDALLRWGDDRNLIRRLGAAAALLVLIVALVLFPGSLDNFPNSKYRIGRNPSLYEFISTRPGDSLIASLAQEVKNLPIFSRRPILVSREYSLPFHTNYYDRMSERASDLIAAHYTADLSALQSFIKKYGVKFVLIERNAFTPEYLGRDTWMMQYQPAAGEAMEKLRAGMVPALQRLMTSCAAFENEDYVLLDADCLLAASP